MSKAGRVHLAESSQAVEIEGRRKFGDDCPVVLVVKFGSYHLTRPFSQTFRAATTRGIDRRLAVFCGQQVGRREQACGKRGQVDLFDTSLQRAHTGAQVQPSERSTAPHDAVKVQGDAPGIKGPLMLRHQHKRIARPRHVLWQFELGDSQADGAQVR
eukprot:343586-Prymnesium_polylepis.1